MDSLVLSRTSCVLSINRLPRIFAHIPLFYVYTTSKNQLSGNFTRHIGNSSPRSTRIPAGRRGGRTKGTLYLIFRAHPRLWNGPSLLGGGDAVWFAISNDGSLLNGAGSLLKTFLERVPF